MTDYLARLAETDLDDMVEKMVGRKVFIPVYSYRHATTLRSLGVMPPSNIHPQNLSVRGS